MSCPPNLFFLLKYLQSTVIYFEYVEFWQKILLFRTKTACLTKSEYSLGGMIINTAFDTVLKNSAIKGVTT